jgi:hypothetical protein
MSSGIAVFAYHGLRSLMLTSCAEYQRLKCRDREVLMLSDFTDEDRAAIAASRVPAETENIDAHEADRVDLIS